MTIQEAIGQSVSEGGQLVVVEVEDLHVAIRCAQLISLSYGLLDIRPLDGADLPADHCGGVELLAPREETPIDPPVDEAAMGFHLCVLKRGLG